MYWRGILSTNPKPEVLIHGAMYTPGGTHLCSAVPCRQATRRGQKMDAAARKRARETHHSSSLECRLGSNSTARHAQTFNASALCTLVAAVARRVPVCNARKRSLPTCAPKGLRCAFDLRAAVVKLRGPCHNFRGSKTRTAQAVNRSGKLCSHGHKEQVLAIGTWGPKQRGWPWRRRLWHGLCWGYAPRFGLHNLNAVRWPVRKREGTDRAENAADPIPT